MLKASVSSDKYGSNKEDDAFCCKFINGVDRITFNGTEISGTKNGDIVFSHSYQCIGTYYIGESEGIEGFGGYAMQSLDNNEDEFKYFLMLPDTMDSSNHIEFRYGSDLAALQLYGQGKYANWVAAGISVDAMNETTGSIGEVDNQLRQVIALFCEENFAYDATGTLVPRSAEALAQLNDFVGIWDANDATLAVMHNYPGFENAKMYVDFKADGTAKTYVAVDGVNYAVSSSYSYFVYDNSSSDKTGVYLVNSAEGVSTAPYEIVTAGSETTLSLYASDGTSAWIKRVAPTRRDSGGGSTSYTVTYKTNGGTEIVSSRISRNSILSEPSVPIKESYFFDGWYTDSQLLAKYDFSSKVTKSLTLYAKWNEKSIDNSKNEIVLTIGKKEVNVFGETKVNDVAPIIKNNRTMLPTRFVAESLGAR